MKNYQLVIDLWKGDALSVDFDALYLNGVRGVILRLNGIDGVLYKDSALVTAWQRAGETPLLRMVYPVYSPWHYAKAQSEWFKLNAPPECKAFALDAELKGTATPFALATAIGETQARLAETHLCYIYSGKWFWDTLPPQPWMKNVEYWWARYPYTFYPDKPQQWTWDNLRSRLDTTDWNPGVTPGLCRMWQISGDRIILPGTGGVPVDINVFNGSEKDLAAWFGGDAAPVTLPLTLEERVARLEDAVRKLGGAI